MLKRGFDLFLIADVVHWKTPAERHDWEFLKDNFQAVTGYNMFDDPIPGGDKFLEAVRKEFSIFDHLARKNGMALIPNVMPGYDDTKLRGRHRSTISRNDGQFYRNYWAMSSEFIDESQPFLLITSFNEWHEGTELEPSKEMGETYLQLTRDLVNALRAKNSKLHNTNIVLVTNNGSFARKTAAK
jgi:hypothetical protein